MKLIIALTLACVAAVSARPGAAYDDKFDHVDVDQILESARVLEAYYNCLLENGPCTPEGKSLKKILPEALENECSNCTPKQKSGSEKVIRFLVNRRPDLWKGLSAKYDPDNKYQARYKDKIEAVKSRK